MAETEIVDRDTRGLLMMAMCAVRYTIGRQSYIVSDGQRWARDYGKQSAWVRGILIRDLEEAVQRHDQGFPALGSDHDAQGWKAVLGDLKAMS